MYIRFVAATHLGRGWVVPALLLPVALLTSVAALLGVPAVLRLLLPVLLVPAGCQWRAKRGANPGSGDEMGSIGMAFLIPPSGDRSMKTRRGV